MVLFSSSQLPGVKSELLEEGGSLWCPLLLRILPALLRLCQALTAARALLCRQEPREGAGGHYPTSSGFRTIVTPNPRLPPGSPWSSGGSRSWGQAPSSSSGAGVQGRENKTRLCTTISRKDLAASESLLCRQPLPQQLFVGTEQPLPPVPADTAPSMARLSGLPRNYCLPPKETGALASALPGIEEP